MKNWNFTNGWSLKTARVKCAVVLGFLMTMLNQQTYANNVTSDEEIPSIEFLEFLGAGITVDEEFLDPMNYDEIETNSLSDSVNKTENEKMQKDDD